jgi:hypothetical protein
LITVCNGEITYNEKHLFDNKVEDLEGIAKRYNDFDVNIFIHIVSDPSCRYESGVGKNRITPDFASLSARERFLSILKKRKLVGNPKGFFANKHKTNAVVSVNNEIKSVSFAYCNMNNVPDHFQARKSKYGIVFFHDLLSDRGVREVKYINETNPESLRSIVFNSAYLLEAYGKSYDMRWEKEWRVKGKLEFDDDEVAFVIVPDEDYDDILNIIIREKVGDYVIMPASVFDDPVQFFYMLPKLEHCYWSQIRIYDDWKVGFDMFPKPTSEELEEFQAKCGSWIEYLRKAAIQELYEYRYIKKFLSFSENIESSHFKGTSLEKLELVSKNSDEPYQTQRDLMMACYTELADIQRNRIDI